MRRWLFVPCLGLIAMACTAGSPGTSATHDLQASITSPSAPALSSNRAASTAGDPGAILVVAVGEQVQPAPPTEAARAALGDAMGQADAESADLGYPWIDPTDGELVLSAATSRGRRLLEAANTAYPHRIRDVAHSVSELRRIQNDVTFLSQAGVVDANLIHQSLPDLRDNRTLIVLASSSPALLDALAARFPADALAIEVNPAQGQAGF